MKTLLLTSLSIVALLLGGPVQAEIASDALHLPFNQLVGEHVNNGVVDYPAMKADPRFESYVASLAEVDAKQLPSREEKLTFWINAYNVLAIKGIIDGRSPDSFFGRVGYFKLAKYEVGGHSISLYDIEHEILRPMGEPRIHFAIVCASQSCPALPSQAYFAEQLEDQLQASAFAFINNPTRNDFSGKPIYLSKIFDWFDQDFSSQAGSVQKYLAAYVTSPELKQQLAAEQLSPKFLDYSWALNGIVPD